MQLFLFLKLNLETVYKTIHLKCVKIHLNFKKCLNLKCKFITNILKKLINKELNKKNRLVKRFLQIKAIKIDLITFLSRLELYTCSFIY